MTSNHEKPPGRHGERSGGLYAPDTARKTPRVTTGRPDALQAQVRFAALVEKWRDQPPGGGVPPPPETPAWQRLGIPAAFRAATVRADHWPSPEVRQFCRSDLAEPRSLFVAGANGVGKSYLAAALALRWGARWVGAGRLILRVRLSWSRGSEESELRIIEELAAPPVIVLDDLLRIQRSDSALATILELIATRIDDGRKTIVTTDQSIEDIAQIDSSLASRLSGFQQLIVTGRDRRRHDA